MPDQALSFYQQAVLINPDNENAYFFMGVTLRSLNRPEIAIQQYKKALDINQYNPDCHFNLGHIYFEDLEDISKAEVCYRRALKSLEHEST